MKLSHYRVSTIASLLFAIGTLPVQAQGLSVQPRPGLWKSEGKTLLNGQDIFASMRKAQAEMLKSLPAEQRAQAEAMMKAQGQPDQNLDCLTPEEARQLRDPQALLDKMHKETPQCRYQITRVNGNTIGLKGRCNDPEGFSGEIEGSYTAHSDTEGSSSFKGSGRFPQAAEMPGIKPSGDGRYQFSMESRQRWVGPNCPKTP